MAAPIKAFIDPTFLSRLGPSTPLKPLFTKLSLTIKQASGLQTVVQTPPEKSIPLVLVAGPAKDKLHLFPKVPTPPMGRQAILTFPSIYKERGGGVTTGQLYPPRAL
jgi:hypothetical protein